MVTIVTSAKRAWDTIQEEFQGNDEVLNVKLYSLRREFELIRSKEFEIIKDYYSKIKEIVSQWEPMGKIYLTKNIVKKNLIFVPKKYDAKNKQKDEVEFPSYKVKWSTLL